jgi:hypothetical protein
MATPYTTCTRTGLNNTIFPKCIRIMGVIGRDPINILG